MNKNRNYKATNSNFIPFIPFSWKKYRVKNLVDQNLYYPIGDGDHGSIKPEMYLDYGIPYIRVQNLSWNGELKLDNVVYISEKVQNDNTKSILRPGDILIAKTGATIGKLGYIPQNLLQANTTSSVGKLTVDFKRFDPKYILYCFQAEHFHDQIWMSASQKSAQPGFNIDDFVNFEIASPKLELQLKIVSYLDSKTSKIDNIIECKKSLIIALNEKKQSIIDEAITRGLEPNKSFKYSGIKDLNMIPVDWKISYLKYFVSLKGRLGWKGLKADEYVENSGYGFLSTPDIKNDKIDFTTINHITKERYLESPEIMLKVNDVLLVKDGSTLGITNIVKDLPFETTVNSSIGVLRVFDESLLLPDYLLYYLRSSFMQNKINELKAGQGVPHLFQKDIKNFTILIPPLNEQTLIVEKIQNYNKKIDLLNTLLEESIIKLQLYRQRIISEVVTGNTNINVC